MRTLLEGFSFTLNPGMKVAVIGEEGCGKSTLLKCIYDDSLIEEYMEYSGHIHKRGLRLGYLPQEMHATDKELRIADYLTKHEINYWRINNHDCYVDFQNLNQRIGSLSGGEKVKLQIMRILSQEPDVLLLDEPTNDIDIKTLDWLEEFIQKVPQAVLFVSHDEILIENVSNQIIHLEQTSRKTICRHTITKLPYSEYITQRESSYAHQTQMARKEKEEYQKKHERWQQLFERVNHEQKVVSRQFAGEGRLLKKKMKTLKSQQRRLDKQKEDMTQLPQIEPPIIPKFDMNISIPAKKLVLDLKLNELSVGSRILSRNLELQVTGSEHLCIIGDNGAGKTTLLRIISNELLMKTDVKAFYMPQDYGEILDFDKTPVEYLAQSYEKEELTRCRTYLGSMRYTSDEMEHSNNELSGGQKAKLLFIKAILGVYNVLILDEPTRNFSAISSKRIREQLRLFPGTVISVSHDRIYIQEACDRVVELSENGLIEIYE